MRITCAEALQVVAHCGKALKMAKSSLLYLVVELSGLHTAGV